MHVRIQQLQGRIEGILGLVHVGILVESICEAEQDVLVVLRRCSLQSNKRDHAFCYQRTAG